MEIPLADQSVITPGEEQGLLSISVLGSLQIRLGGTPITQFRFERVRALLTYLAVESGHVHSRVSLASMLWEEATQDVALQNLRQTLATLRRVLDDKNQKSPYILTDSNYIWFNGQSQYSLDLDQFNRHIKSVKQHKHRRIGACPTCICELREAALLYRGSFLSNLSIDSNTFEEWQHNISLVAHEQITWVMRELIEYYIHHQEYQEAIFFARKQLLWEPLCTNAHHRLMEALAADGQRNAALSHYKTYRQLLQKELAVEPPLETRQLYEQIASHNWYPARWTSPKPAVLDELLVVYGYQAERAYITERLASAECRLLTLAGPGGSGKSHLAQWVVHVEGSHFRDGAYLIDLAETSSDDLVAAIVAGLPLDATPHVPLKTQLLQWLRNKEILLLLDNFEHLSSQALLLITMLWSAPSLKILVTSREWLQVKGEIVLPIYGLEIPTYYGAQAWEQYSSVQYFLASVRHFQPEFQPQTDKDWEIIVRLCQYVDGLPLAIEFLAYWLEVYTLPEILKKIQAGVNLLVTPIARQQARQRSISTIFNELWLRLSEQERLIFAQLCLFRSSFSLEAALTITSTSLNNLLAIQTRSLLRPAQPTLDDNKPFGTSLATTRYCVPELYQPYGRKYLYTQPQVMRTVMDAYRRYYTSLLFKRVSKLTDEERNALRGWIYADLGNFRQAWLLALRQQQYYEAALIQNSLAYFDIPVKLHRPENSSSE
jgi:DNA-binding SARP family transcriptional activator